MKNISQKTKALIKTINTCNPDDFLKYRFHDFCQDLIYGDSSGSAYLSIDEFIDIHDRVVETGMSFDVPEEDVDEDLQHLAGEFGDEVDGEELDGIADDQHFYFSFGIFVFKCYVKHCFAVAKSSRSNMKGFCDLIDEKYFNDGFYDNIIEYYFYFKRKENEDMEKSQVDNMVKAFVFFSDLSNIDFFYGVSDDDVKEYLESMKDYIQVNYVCYLEALYLAFSNFLNFLNNLIFVNDMGLDSNPV